MAYVLNTRFNPFSLQEMLQLASAATEAHNNMEQQYATMKSNANIFQRQIDPNDTELKDIYDKYMKDLDEAASNLSKQGLNKDTSQSIYDLAARFNSDIAPIDTAFKRKAQLVEELRQLKLKDPSFRAEIDPNTILVSSLIKNPNQGYGRSISLNNDITNKVYNIAKNLSTYVEREPDTWKKILGDQYYEEIRKSGYSPSEVQSIIDGKNGQDILARIANMVIDSSGASDYVSQEELWNAAAQGMMAAVGKYDYNTLLNHGWTNPNTKKEDDENTDAPLYPQSNIFATFGDLSPYEYYSKYKNKQPLGAAPEGYKFLSLFAPNDKGEYALRDYQTVIENQGISGSVPKGVDFNPKNDPLYSELKNYANSNGIDTTKDNWEMEAFHTAMENIGKGDYHDAVESDEYYVGLDDISWKKAQIPAKAAIANVNNIIYPVKYNRETGSYEKGKSETFDPEKDKITGIYWDPYTKSLTFSINDKNQRYLYPINNRSFKEEFDSGVSVINIIDKAIKEGKDVAFDENYNIDILNDSTLSRGRELELRKIRKELVTETNNLVYKTTQ